MAPLSRSRPLAESDGDERSELKVEEAAAPFRLMEAPRERRGVGAMLRNKGDMSNLLTFTVMVIGLVVRGVEPDSVGGSYVLAAGLFGFAGGLTNWLAVKMLFDRIPFVYGSGVIPNNHSAIIASLKDMIMRLFFDGPYLERYINERSRGLLGSLDLGPKLREAMAKPDVDAKIAEKLQAVAESGAQGNQEGMMLSMVLQMFGGSNVPPLAEGEVATGPRVSPGATALTPMVKPLMVGLGEEMIGMLARDVDISSLVSIDRVREELNLRMEEKLRIISPEMVKELMEHVIQESLTWLVVWGNVFGALIGVIAEAAGY